MSRNNANLAGFCILRRKFTQSIVFVRCEAVIFEVLKAYVYLAMASLTKAVDMGHTWSKYRNGMGQPMTNVWVLYGFYMGH